MILFFEHLLAKIPSQQLKNKIKFQYHLQQITQKQRLWLERTLAVLMKLYCRYYKSGWKFSTQRTDFERDFPFFNKSTENEISQIFSTTSPSHFRINVSKLADTYKIQKKKVHFEQNVEFFDTPMDFESVQARKSMRQKFVMMPQEQTIAQVLSNVL